MSADTITGPYWLSVEAQRIAETICDRVGESAKCEVQAIEAVGIPDQTLRYWAVGRWRHISPWHPAYDTVKRDYDCQYWDAKHYRWRHFAF